MKNERTVYTTRGCFPFILFSPCKRKNENGYNGSYFFFSLFVWGLEKKNMMLSYPFSNFYYGIEKRKTKGRYIHGPKTTGKSFTTNMESPQGDSASAFIFIFYLAISLNQGNPEAEPVPRDHGYCAKEPRKENYQKNDHLYASYHEASFL